MEKHLNTVEKIAWPVAVLGLAAKWALVPAGSYLLILALGALAAVYFLRSYWPAAAMAGGGGPSAAAPASFLGDYLRKVTGISAAVTLVGTLFKLMNWGSGNTLLVVGVATMALVVVGSALSGRWSWLAVALAALGALALYVPSETMIQTFHRDDPGLVERLVYQLHHPRDRAAAEAVQQYLRQKPGPR
ncbi:GldL-related protein [Hymenobacter sp. PAMC 26628]|uniref:GldL-related protein n=1 Tax=Hymenobacter sp. PAMC 26628 TaxID=1484118 RepID=UPI0007703895|nr:hypothetical protein [Hymenobacter sp. PAMC 26628]AMJ66280.1 hypothetical protein AXW84_13160 [Hymenobacter sp. PAMC 26628]